MPAAAMDPPAMFRSMKIAKIGDVSPRPDSTKKSVRISVRRMGFMCSMRVASRSELPVVRGCAALLAHSDTRNSNTHFVSLCDTCTSHHLQNFFKWCDVVVHAMALRALEFYQVILG